MNLLDRTKQILTVGAGVALTVLMFPVLLATTSFLLLTGIVGALLGTYKMRQFVQQAEQTMKPPTRDRHTSEGQTIEGSYYVVHPSH